MNHERRTVLRQLSKVTGYALALLAGAWPRLGWSAEQRPAFTAETLEETLKALGASGSKESSEIEFKAPEIAENGAVVPVEVDSKLPGTRSIAIIVEKNPHLMSADFTFPEGTDPYVATRVKVAETSNLLAVVKTDAGVFHATRLVKVTLGGCGG
ncbi:MAG: thiosulfate oxidation carrier protein SoxY [Gammaproteobacteria bacterium]|nr:thiosulfate oxidation carrier protein SoxY [Gammaproteobacteria bacterium]